MSRTTPLEHRGLALVGGISMFGLAIAGMPAAAQTPTPSEWRTCAIEGASCNFRGQAMVRYGADGRFVSKLVAGGVLCGGQTFGDPAPGVAKHCELDLRSRIRAPEEDIGAAGVAIARNARAVYAAATAAPAGAVPAGAAPAGAAPAGPAPVGDGNYGAVPPARPTYDAPPNGGYQELPLAPPPGRQSYDAPPNANQYGQAPPPRSYDAPPNGGYQELPLAPPPGRQTYDAPPAAAGSGEGDYQYPVVRNGGEPEYQYPVARNGGEPEYQHPVVRNGGEPEYQHPVVRNGGEEADVFRAPYQEVPAGRETYDLLPVGNVDGGGEDVFRAPYAEAPARPAYDAPPVAVGGEAEAGVRPAGAPDTPGVSGHLAGLGKAAAIGAVAGAGITAITLAASGQEVTLHDPTKLEVRGPSKDFCWVDSYPNTAGEVQSGCEADREWRDSMCYVRCNPGEEGSMTMCKSACPAGYRTDPLTCWRDVDIIAADNSKCPWYDVCGLTLAPGCSSCPEGYKNDGCTCRIDADMTSRVIRDVGIGHAGSGCREGYEKDPSGLLCYPKCKDGYNMVGPVCWADTCTAEYPIKCGLACAVSQDACTLGTFNLVMKPLELVQNIIGMVVTGGAENVAKAGATAAAKAGTAAAGKAAITAALKDAAQQAGKQLAEAAISTAAGTFASAELTGGFSWYDLDPIGVAQIVEVYNKPICKGPPKP